MNIYDIESQLAALAVERDAAVARAEKAEAEVERMRGTVLAYLEVLVDVQNGTRPQAELMPQHHARLLDMVEVFAPKEAMG